MYKKIIILMVAVVLVGSIFVRFFNLEETTRFTRDESQNLVDMHRIYVDRDITLLGPIDPTTAIIYPSLTFYMLLPFTILGNFEPGSPALGTAFFGVVTVFLFALLAKKVNKKFVLPSLLLTSIWYPLVESSRWAWNPHLAPFMTVLALIFYVSGNLTLMFLSGVLFGLSFHLHYLTVVSFGVFLGLSSIIKLKQKAFKETFAPIFGFVLTLLPFIFFDLKNPPGLFFTKFVSSNLVRTGAGNLGFSALASFPENVYKSFLFLGQNKLFTISLLILSVFPVIYDLKRKRTNLIFLLPVVAQIGIISFLPVYQTRYFLLSLPFLFVWLIKSRNIFQERVAKVMIGVMIVGSLMSLHSLLTIPTRPPDAASVRIISNYIKDDISKNDLKNVNIAVLESIDPDPLGLIYRHTLLVKEARILTSDEYGITDNLFVVSTASEETIRKSSGSLINNFRSGPLVKTYNVSNKPWKVYLFNRY